MFWEYAESIVQLLANMTAMLLCLYRFIGRSRKAWLCAILFFLSNFLSCYFWVSYLIIMGDWPNVSTLMTYFGWNLGYVFMLLLMLQTKTKEEKRYFHPLMLLPIPLNIWQLTVYNRYSDVANNIYQTLMCTAFACLGIQGLCWWYRHRGEKGVKKPWVSLAGLLYATCEFGMWTCSCYDEPVLSFYYVFSFLCSAVFFFLIWAVDQTCGGDQDRQAAQLDTRYQKILRQTYLLVVLACSVGGVLLGIHMRNMIAAQIGDTGSSDVFGVISLVLFAISIVIAAFAIIVMMVAYFAHRAAENNKLREAKRIAEQASQAKSDFLANMSHEIRTPINAVMGMNEMIMRESRAAAGGLKEGQEDLRDVFRDICGYSGNIENAGKNLLSIVNDILDISRIEAGKMEIREDSYQLRSVLSDACNMVAFKANEKGIDLRTEVEKTLPEELYGDEMHIRQVITNLLNNAVKYTRQGTVTLSVHGETDAPCEPGSLIRLHIGVRDTGIGIRQEDAEKLFTKFERIDLKENSTIEGSGLGLAICKNLLDMMGGTISVESEYGKGSLFTAVIPQTVVSAAPLGEFSFTEDRNRPASSSREAFRAPEAHILVVDDTWMNIMVVQGLLKTTRIVSDAAMGGEEAVELCGRNRYDLILMDQRMPNMDGAEAMRLIRGGEDSLNRETPVVCLTADAVMGARQRYLAEGYTDYLTKPVNGEALERMLIHYLPPEKVELTEHEETGSNPEPKAEAKAEFPGAEELRAAGVRPETGMYYCQGDEDLYRAALRQFASDAEKTEKQLAQYLEEKDWRNYGIRVHALKSTSRLIGAEALGEKAAQMETAARAGDGTTVENGHDDIIAMSRALAETIRWIFPQKEKVPPEEDEQVMEFLPE